ncbi:MAG: radical SAM protein [Candidatus Thermoplasmatota archaeon]
MGSRLNDGNYIRVSYGTAMTLDLKEGDTKEEPTTAYVMNPGEKCRGGCTFCPQARGDSKWLSRVSWPLLDIKKVKNKIEDSDLSRVCVQSPDIPHYESKLKSIVDELDDLGKPISLSTPPLGEETLKELKGPVDRIGVGIDAATDRLRKKKKSNYEPIVFWNYLGKAVDIYGESKVTAHLIVGLGETLDELAAAVKKALDAGAEVSLFSYQTESEEAELEYYRSAQLLTALLAQERGVKDALDLTLNEPEEALQNIDVKKTFQTRGCPGCNRPYYTSSPGQEHRNFPREPTKEEIEDIRDELGVKGGE